MAADQTPQQAPPSPQPEADVEKQKCDASATTDSNEPLEKVKVRAPPGINASVVLLYAVFFFMFATGWVNLNSCSISRLIPIYLIVSGFVGTLGKFLSTFEEKYLFNIAIGLAMIYCVWQGFGTYWVYREFRPNDDPHQGKYCNRIAYLTAFWILTLQYTFLGFLLVVPACHMLMKNGFQMK